MTSLCCWCVELVDDDDAETSDGFPVWLIIVLTLASLSLVVVSLMSVLTVCRRLTTAAAVAARGSAFVRMESGGVRWNLPSPERRVWTSSHSLPPPLQHSVVDMPVVSKLSCCPKCVGGGGWLSSYQSWQSYQCNVLEGQATSLSVQNPGCLNCFASLYETLGLAYINQTWYVCHLWALALLLFGKYISSKCPSTLILILTIVYTL